MGTKSGSVDDPRVVEAVQAYLAALESGERPDRGDFLAQYPDLADVLGGCLDALDMVHACVPQLGGPDDGVPLLARPAVDSGDETDRRGCLVPRQT